MVRQDKILYAFTSPLNPVESDLGKEIMLKGDSAKDVAFSVNDCRAIYKVWYGVVWCGVVWYGVVWCGVVWCGVVWCGVVWWRRIDHEEFANRNYRKQSSAVPSPFLSPLKRRMSMGL